MARDLELRISAARDEGYVVWEDGVVVAAKDDPQQLAMYIERRAMQVEGEADRFREETQSDFPNVIRATPRKGLFSRG